ncbi:MAG: hypothetical protein PHC89_01010 [Candidatus Pacebacteria bacterium]|nr:hypothetical protein [Candidatus Paceibacterota bacterium]
MKYISYEDFKKVDMRMGRIQFVEPVEGTDKLLRCEIDFGELPIVCSGECDGAKACTKDHRDGETCDHVCGCELPPLPFDKEEYRGRNMRQIVSGIREYFPDFKSLEGKYALYVLNLEPREIRGVMSEGMLVAVDGVDGNPVLLSADGEIAAGAKVR